MGELRTALPAVYSISTNGVRNDVDARFQILEQNDTRCTFGITLPNGHESDKELRIDPLVYSTFLGGSSNEEGIAIKRDSIGNIVVLGKTVSSDFPTTPGVGDSTYNGNVDCFITKLDSTLSQLLYSTYLGGVGNEDPRDILVYNDGTFVITGSTTSANFPTRSGPGFAGDNNAFFTKIGPSGNLLAYSFLYYNSAAFFKRAYGASLVDDGHNGCYVGGSSTASDFPWSEDGFIFHFDTNGQMLANTFFGGSDFDDVFSISASGDSCFYVCGWTGSSNFPVTTRAYSRTLNGMDDAFIVKVSRDSLQIQSATYFGSSSSGYASDLAITSTGSIAFIGFNYEQPIPLQPTSYDTNFNVFTGYVAVLSSDLTSLVASTYIGGDSSNCLSVQTLSNGNILVVGQCAGTNFSTTPNAFQPSYGGNRDAYFAILDSNCSHLLYSTYLGGSGTETCNGAMLLSDRRILLTGSTASSSFPVTPSAYDTTLSGSDCYVTCLEFDEVGVVEPKPILQPHQITLSQNFPNPFNSSTTLSYTIPKAGQTELKLFDVMGREVKTLVSGKLSAGSYRYTLDGNQLASGTYFIRLQSANEVQTKKVVLLR